MFWPILRSWLLLEAFGVCFKFQSFQFHVVSCLQSKIKFWMQKKIFGQNSSTNANFYFATSNLNFVQEILIWTPLWHQCIMSNNLMWNGERHVVSHISLSDLIWESGLRKQVHQFCLALLCYFCIFKALIYKRFMFFNISMHPCLISAHSFQLENFHCSILCAKIPRIQCYWAILALSKGLVPVCRKLLENA